MAANLLGSKGGWLSSLARRVASKQQQQQQGEQHRESVSESAHEVGNLSIMFPLAPAWHAAAAPGGDASAAAEAGGPAFLHLSCADAPAAAGRQPALRRLPSDAGFFDRDCADLTLNKSPKPEAPSGYRAWYLLLREKDDLKDMNEGWAPRRGEPTGSHTSSGS